MYPEHEPMTREVYPDEHFQPRASLLVIANWRPRHDQGLGWRDPEVVQRWCNRELRIEEVIASRDSTDTLEYLE